VQEAVDGVLEAGDEVELAEQRKPAHVGDDDARLRHLERRPPDHLGREIARRDLIASVGQRDEALAGAARDVQHAPAGEPVTPGDVLELGEPAVVVTQTGGEGVVGGGERVVGDSNGMGAGERCTVGEADDRRHVSP
jgi:hypothetical protein